MSEVVTSLRLSGAALASLLGGAIGRFHLLREFASSPLTRDFYARMTGVVPGERVAVVRIWHAALSTDPEFRSEFLEAMRKAMALRDDRLLAPIDAGCEKAPYVATEYFESGSVAEIFERTSGREQPVPIAIVVAVAIGVLRALEVCHAAALVHDWLSPACVWVGIDGVVRLGDLGFAPAAWRVLASGADGPTPQVAYAAPERLAKRSGTASSDVFSAGATIWELLTGRRLFLGSTDEASRRNVARGPIALASSRRPDVPAALDDLVQKALDRDPAQRPTSAFAMRTLIEQCGVAPATSSELGDFVNDACVRWISNQRGLLLVHAVEAPTGQYAALVGDYRDPRPLRSQPPKPIPSIAPIAHPSISMPPAKAAAFVPVATPRPRRRRGMLVTSGIVVLIAAAAIAGVRLGRRDVRAAASTESLPDATTRSFSPSPGGVPDRSIAERTASSDAASDASVAAPRARHRVVHRRRRRASIR